MYINYRHLVEIYTAKVYVSYDFFYSEGTNSSCEVPCYADEKLSRCINRLNFLRRFAKPLVAFQMLRRPKSKT